jgi:phage shock protein A
MPDEANSEPEPAASDVDAEPAQTAAPTPPAQPPESGYTPGGVPTFESVREKIETRYGTAIGATELATESPEGRTVEEQYEARQHAAAERLEQIRESMRDAQERHNS